MPVFSVAVTPYTPTLALGSLAADDVHNADLVVTTQLTGCSFMYQASGSAMHIYPNHQIGGEDLCQKLSKEGKFPNALAKGATMVFGPSTKGKPKRYDPSNVWTYIFGIKKSNVWELHAQQCSKTDREAQPTYWRVPTC